MATRRAARNARPRAPRAPAKRRASRADKKDATRRRILDVALYFFELEVDHAIDAVRANTRLAKATLEERLFALVQYQLDYLQRHERFISVALVQALRPESQLGISARSIALRNRYLAFVR